MRRVNIPSVTTSIRVSLDTLEPKRTRYPTVAPTFSRSVPAMRAAAARAAIRRGSSTIIFLSRAQACAASTSGTRVVFPAPGGATSTMVLCATKAAVSSGRAASIGSGPPRCMPGYVGELPFGTTLELPHRSACITRLEGGGFAREVILRRYASQSRATPHPGLPRPRPLAQKRRPHLPDRRFLLHLSRLPRAPAAHPKIGRSAGQRRARLLQHVVEVAARDETGGATDAPRGRL